MAQSYTQIQQKIAKLEREAQALRTKETAAVVAKIRDAIEVYGITAEELYASRSPQSKNGNTIKSKLAASRVKFADGRGAEWGGRGPRPLWLRAAIEAGKSLEDFAVGSVSTATKRRSKSSAPEAAGSKTSKPTKSKSKSPNAVVKFADGKGGEWVGMGPRPLWLREALAAGGTLEDFAVAGIAPKGSRSPVATRKRGKRSATKG